MIKVGVNILVTLVLYQHAASEPIAQSKSRVDVYH